MERVIWKLVLAGVLGGWGAAGAETRAPAGWIADGTPHRTPYYVVDSAEAGPTVMVVGGVHGNEPAGARAAGQIRHWAIRRGKLIVLPRANVRALAARERRSPDEPRETGDLNRCFPRSGAADEARSKLARALWGFVHRQKPDWLLDLHEGVEPRAGGSKSVGASIIYQPAKNTRPAVDQMLEAVNAEIEQAGRKFLALRPPADGSLARAAAERLGAHAMIVETARKDQHLALRARQHRIMVARLLRRLGMVDAAVGRLVAPRQAGRARPVSVAIYNGTGTGDTTLDRVEGVLRRQGLTVVEPVGPGDIGEGALKQFDVVIFPGGSGSKQAKAIGESGRRRVRRFVEAGGGYVGICAGAYLATYDYVWSLKILDARTIDRKHWNRGTGMVKIEMTPAGRRILGGGEGLLNVYYGQGPLLGPTGIDSLPDYDTLAHYRGEIAKKGAPTGVMIDTPAIVSAPFGRGRVICISPHPEKPQSEPALRPFVLRAVRWAARRPSGEPVDAAGAKPKPLRDGSKSAAADAAAAAPTNR